MDSRSTPDLARVDAYRYALPERLIAQVPAEPPDAARLMVLAGQTTRHERFVDFPSLLRAGDLLVINETRVVRARLHGTREPGGGRAEVFLLRPAAGGRFSLEARDWHVLVKPGRKLERGALVRFGDDETAEIIEVRADGSRVVRFAGRMALVDVLDRHGEMPLPPYVGPGDETRAQRYQTIFARTPGSVAAPTASLHFTPRVLEALSARGVSVAALTLDVGLGTFKPMEGPTLDEHAMHAEHFAIPPATAEAVNAAKREGRRVVVAGTTALRALEASAAAHGGLVAGGEDETALFIRPGFRFLVADVLLTNFHLPGSTLMVLVSAFGGYERIARAYATAITEEYRFYSFGDAMLIDRADK